MFLMRSIFSRLSGATESASLQRTAFDDTGGRLEFYLPLGTPISTILSVVHLCHKPGNSLGKKQTDELCTLVRNLSLKDEVRRRGKTQLEAMTGSIFCTEDVKDGAVEAVVSNWINIEEKPSNTLHFSPSSSEAEDGLRVARSRRRPKADTTDSMSLFSI